MIFDPAEEMRRYLREYPTIEALRQHLLAHPEDEASRLVYADAVAESGDHVAEYLANPPTWDDDDLPPPWMEPEDQVLIPWPEGWPAVTDDDAPW